MHNNEINGYRVPGTGPGQRRPESPPPSASPGGEHKRESRTRYALVATEDEPFVLQNGAKLGPVTIAYETFGTLNERRDNVIVLFHALSGSQHAAGYDPVGPNNEFWAAENHHGWWERFIGPGRALDTDKYHIVCCNFLGGCYGSTGPTSTNPATGRPYGRDFPYPTISDIVDTQVRVLDQLGIHEVLAVVGGSLGGFCVIDMALRYPDRVRCVIPIASGLRATVLSKALNFEQIFAIAEDSNFRGGDYYDGEYPWRGLALARMISHKTFISLREMENRARNEIIQPTDVLSGYLLEHKIESYLFHQGRKFVERFDANSYLRIVNAWQSFDLPKEIAGEDAVGMFKRAAGQKWLVFSISSDVCFYVDEQKEIAQCLKANDIEFQYITANSDKGHDSFLLDPDLFTPHIVFMLSQVHSSNQATIG